jgi:hypothetical protein
MAFTVFIGVLYFRKESAILLNFKVQFSGNSEKSQYLWNVPVTGEYH